MRKVSAVISDVILALSGLLLGITAAEQLIFVDDTLYWVIF